MTPRWWPPLALLGAAIVALLLAGLPAHAESGKLGFGDHSTYLTPPPAGKAAERVYVGVEPIGFDDIDVSAQAFKTSFYIWWRWRGPIDPVPTTDVLNSARASSYYVLNYSYTDASGAEKPTKLPDGEMYQTARLSTGITDPFPVNRYPLDHQNLRVRIENNTYDYAQLVYVPDLANMTREPEIEVSGWQVDGSSLTNTLHQYGTNFGVLGGGVAASQYSQLIYDVQIERPVSHFIVKLFIPLLVIFTAALAALLVKEDKFDVRLVMVATGLLTLILLQQGYGADLPATAPGVLMDDLYIAAYLGLGATFLRVIYTANQIHHMEKRRHDYIKGDRIIAAGIWGTFIAASAILVAV